MKIKRCKCGKIAHIHDTDEDKYFCTPCWHKYPTGFKCTGWEFIQIDLRD